MTTIRDPQTDVSSADHTIDGIWEFDNKLTYTAPLSFTNDNEIVDKLYVDSRIVGGVPEDNIYYVGKHGNDISSGRNIGQAFLTIQKGIDEANTQTPTINDQYVVRINDGGSYDSFTLASKPYIQVISEGAQFQSSGSSFIIGDHNTVNFDKGTYVSGSGIFFQKNGTAESYLNGSEISSTSITEAITVTEGILYSNISKIDVGISNIAFSVFTDAELNFDGHDIVGKIQIGVDGYANISVHSQIGDISVGDGGILNLVINGSLDGNITADANSVINILLADRGAYIDDINQDANVNIDYIGHNLDQHRNFLIGADYAINPRQEVPSGLHAFADNDSYVADNTILLSDGDGIVSVTKGLNDSLSMTVGTVNKQFGILIPVENKDSLEVIGDKASISLRATWVAGNIRDLRMALLSWDGGKDNITTDVVSSWAATPTLIANWTYENTPSDLSFEALNITETFKIEDISVDTVDTKNIAVFIWVAETILLLGDELQISNVRGNKGKVIEDFALRPFTEELLLCKRFYDKSYNLETVPGTATYDGCASNDKDNLDYTHGFMGMNIRFKTSMLKTPSIIPYSPYDGEANKVRSERHPSHNTPAPGTYIGTDGCQLIPDPIPLNPSILSYHWTADARF